MAGVLPSERGSSLEFFPPKRFPSKQGPRPSQKGLPSEKSLSLSLSPSLLQHRNLTSNENSLLPIFPLQQPSRNSGPALPRRKLGDLAPRQKSLHPRTPPTTGKKTERQALRVQLFCYFSLVFRPRFYYRNCTPRVAAGKAKQYLDLEWYQKH